MKIQSTTESFVYRWTNKENSMYYIGKHKGTENDGYISSGKFFLHAYYQNPSIFQRDILYRGTDKECLRIETEQIRESIKLDGYEKIYNLTTWSHLKQWSRRCLVCNSVCCPENKQWADMFELYHFNNCTFLTGEKIKSYLYGKKTPIDTLYPIINRKIHPGLGVFVVRRIGNAILIALHSEKGYVHITEAKITEEVQSYIEYIIDLHEKEKSYAISESDKNADLILSKRKRKKISVE